MTANEIKALIRTIPDFPQPGILFRDVTTLIGHGAGFAATVALLANQAQAAGAEAIAGIESGAKRELSSAYRYQPVMEAGTYEGQRYDGRMVRIVGNHVAIVPEGRAGSDVVVGDAAWRRRSSSFEQDLIRRFPGAARIKVSA